MYSHKKQYLFLQELPTLQASEFYVPPEKTVSTGATVTWTNDDATIHTVTDKGGTFDSSIIAPTATWEHTFDTAGEFDYDWDFTPIYEW